MKKVFQIGLLACAALLARPAFAQMPNMNMTLRSSMTIPGQTLANVSGYAQGGREYALLGASQGMIIVDITNPDVPVQIVQIPGPNSLWKEIKTYSHYAYVVSEGGQGLQIVDLSALPSSTLNYHHYLGDGAIDNLLKNIHALHIDQKKGFVYLYGANSNGLFAGAPIVLDLNNDPYNPTYAGNFVFQQSPYVHDGYVDNDTLYAGHIYAGITSIVDMKDKQNPVLLGTLETPGKFTHNTWLLDDHKHLLTTDEKLPSWVTSFDISDPSDAVELSRVSPNDGNGSIGHNTHVLNDWAITSWYIDGVMTIDAHKPDNLVITGAYDTWAPAFDGDEFKGCWGVYPFLPSGNFIATNIAPGQFFVLTPTYQRACYLEGKITNGCSGNPLPGATVSINSGLPLSNNVTKSNGSYKTGQVTPGSFQVTVSKTGYVSKTVTVTLATAQVTPLDLSLDPVAVSNVEGGLFNPDGSPLANTPFVLQGPDQYYLLQTGPDGSYDLSCVINGQYSVGVWGYLPEHFSVDASGPYLTTLEKGYYDDFEFDLGWTKENTSPTGKWERGEPIGTEIQNNVLANPDTDLGSDDNDQCYITGNGGGEAGDDDVDNGSVTLTTPPMKLAAYEDATLSFWYWFFNGGGSGTPNDNFTVKVTNGQQTATVLTVTDSESDWRFSEPIHLKDFITPLTDDVRVQFIASDELPGHVVEAGVDVFKMEPGALVGAQEVNTQAMLAVAPNPSTEAFTLHYTWPEAGAMTLEVRNLLGQLVESRVLEVETGKVTFGKTLPAGMYVAVLKSNGRQSAPVSIVKQ